MVKCEVRTVDPQQRSRKLYTSYIPVRGHVNCTSLEHKCKLAKKLTFFVPLTVLLTELSQVITHFPCIAKELLSNFGQDTGYLKTLLIFLSLSMQVSGYCAN